jgi:deoxyribodipyrimidine photo-lyase
VEPVVVVLTRDLRLSDHPGFTHAARSGAPVTPLFVLDDAILGSDFNRPNRTRFLLESLTDLDGSLRSRGSELSVRRGQWVDEVVAAAKAVGAATIRVADDVTSYAQRRLRRLEDAAGRERIAVVRDSGVNVVAAGALEPAGGDHYKVFTPYFRRWSSAAWAPVTPAPARLTAGLAASTTTLPELADVCAGAPSPAVVRGGETTARASFDRWRSHALAEYPARRDDLAGDATSRLSPYLHFGCISPTEVATTVRGLPGGEELARQLCWRDFFHQVLHARPDAAWSDYRDRGFTWHDDPDAFERWADGTTGYPLVDAGMRQLRREGFMHNRARMVVASFLTKDLLVDWRLGARHFLDWLVDGDIADNNLGWQWVAGTGTDTNPRRVLNPTRQGARFDPSGDYVRRHVDELAGVEGRAVHDPDSQTRSRCGYPAPIVDHHDAIAEYRTLRS